MNDPIAAASAKSADRLVGLLGDESTHPSHMELNALRPRLLNDFGVETAWVPTDSAFDVRSLDGLWLVPGSPYRDDEAVLEALRVARTEGIPFMGTCGGMQYAVIEFLRNVLGVHATHAESEGERDDNAIVPLACSLRGQVREVVPTPDTPFEQWVGGPFAGVHYCDFAPSNRSIELLEASGVTVAATATDAGAEALDFPDHPFYVASLFQPHVGTIGGAPTHELVRAFMAAVADS